MHLCLVEQQHRTNSTSTSTAAATTGGHHPPSNINVHDRRRLLACRFTTAVKVPTDANAGLHETFSMSPPPIPSSWGTQYLHLINLSIPSAVPSAIQVPYTWW